MHHGLRNAAAAAVLVGGLVAAGSAPASATATTASAGTSAVAAQSPRITTREQLAAGIEQAVAAEQQRGVVASGAIGGRCVAVDVHDADTASR
jgi:hypothetical protein